MKISSSLTKQLLSDDSVKALSKSSGASSKQVEKVVSAALPILMQGMKNNSKTKSGAASLKTALSDHSKTDLSDIASFLTDADQEDGAKIVKHVLGGSKTDIEKGLASKSGASSKAVGSILSSLAPALLSLVGSQAEDSSSDKDETSGIGSLLGSLMGKDDDDDDDDDLDLGNIASLLLGSSSGSSSSSGKTGSILNVLLKLFGDD